MIRQQAILDQGRPRVAAVLGEAALHQQIGGTAVLSTQLRHIAAVTRQHSQVSVQVLPFSAGTHPASGAGPLTVLELAGNPLLGVACLGAPAGRIYLEDPTAVTAHASLLHRLQAAALPPEESARRIAGSEAATRP